MIYTEKTKKAIRIMFELHKNQLDKGDMPYVFHPWHVAESMFDEKRTIVALLHDSVEDTEITIEKLREEGFEEDILEAIEILTHDEGDYFEYIKKIATNEIARDVKIADLKHNIDLTRISDVKEKDLLRVQKYKQCLELLENSKQKSIQKVKTI